jgi:hypothetical protein
METRPISSVANHCKPTNKKRIGDYFQRLEKVTDYATGKAGFFLILRF